MTDAGPDIEDLSQMARQRRERVWRHPFYIKSSRSSGYYDPRSVIFGCQGLIFGATVLYVLNAPRVPVRFWTHGVCQEGLDASMIGS